MFDFLIHSPVAHFARSTPDHPAFSCSGSSMSYAELDRASSRLAHALCARGVQHQDRVGIYMRKGLPLGPAIYGILKAGAVFVPLDPFLPVERLAFILKDCGIRHVVTTDAMAERLVELGDIDDVPTDLKLFGIDVATPFSAETTAQLAERSTIAPEVWIVDQDLGYIMCTSGSTGVPKGIMHTHHGSISYARWGAQHVGLTAADRVASHAPLHFDLSIFDFFSTAQVGGTVVLVPEPVTKFPASWTQCIEDERISVVFTVPFTLIEMLERGALEQRDTDSLRWILFGGEPFPPKHLRAVMQALPRVRFTNVYGPAEAPSCTCYDIPPVDAASEASEEPVPIGTVSVNSEDLILDEEDRECAVEEPGELCIRSSTLTKGYWNRPDLNERVFLQRPGLGHFPDLYFRTGDLVVRHADGLLRFLGRKDRMVKVRGHRVELDEVEAALVSHAQVSEAAAFVVPDGLGSQAIRAAVTLQVRAEQVPGNPSEADSLSADLLRHARTKLPAYSVPAAVVIADDFPRTTSGKIDRKRLAEEAVAPTD